MTSQNLREELGIKDPFDENFPLLTQSARAKTSNDARQESHETLSPICPLCDSLTHTTKSLLGNS